MYSAHQPESGSTPMDPIPNDFRTLDRTLVLSRLQEGDEEAWDDLLEEHAVALLSVAHALCDSDAAANFAIRQAWRQAQRSISAQQGGRPLLVWLLKLTVRACAKQLRGDLGKRSPTIESLLPTFTIDGRHEHHVGGWTTAAAHELECPDARVRVVTQIRQLPPDHRLALILCDALDIPTTDAAYITDASVSLVRERLHRARQGLLTLLDRHTRSPMSA